MTTSARRLSILTAACCAAASVVRSAQGQTIVAGPTTAELTAAVGERVTIPIAIDMTGAPGINMGAYRVRLSWSPVGFTFVGASGGTFASPVFNSDNAANGELRFAAASATGANGIFTLADVTLEVQATISDTIRVVFEELTAASTFENLLPFLTVTSGTFCGSDVWGDLDGNGPVQSRDAQIVLMHAVGMPVADTARGDVDPDGKVDPRDALVILSFVVGLDVSTFLVGQPISEACTPGDPDQVTVLPSPLALAPGDQFQLSAQVRDAAGVLLAGKNVVWSSDDAAVATVDASGVVTAVGAGSAMVSAAVSPGISGNTAVSVGQRTRWIVNPAGAQGQQDEVGSEQYPFSTIANAITAAQDGDTVFLHVATYNEPLTTTKSLVFEGDSGAAGMPTISTPNAPAGSISATGKVAIRRLNIVESASGLVIGADTLEVQSVVLGPLRGPALQGTVNLLATLQDVSANGALGAGISITGDPQRLSLSRVTVTAVQASIDPGVFGILGSADTVLADSVTVRAVEGTAFAVPSAQLARIQRTTVSDFEDAGIWADVVTTLEISDSVFVERGSGVGIDPTDIDTLRLADATLRDIDGHALEIGPGAYDLALITDVMVERVWDGFLAFSGGGVRASVVTSRVSDADFTGIALLADTLLVDRTVVERTGQRAVDTYLATYARVVDSDLRDVGAGIESYTGTGYLEVVGTDIRGVRFGDAIAAQADSMVLLNDTIVGVSQQGGVELSFAAAFRMRDSHVSSTAWEGVYLDDVVNVEIVNVTLDSTTQELFLGSTNGAVEIYDASTARVDSNRIRYSGTSGVVANRVVDATIRNNVFVSNQFNNPATSGFGYSSYSVVYTYDVGSALVRNNVFTDNRGAALYSYFQQAGEATVFDTNSVRGGFNAVYAAGADSLTGRMEVRGNQIVGDITGNISYNTYAWLIGTLIHEGNVIDSIAGWGVYAYRADAVTVQGNSLTNVDTRSGYGVVGEDIGVAEFDGNTVECVGGGNDWGLALFDTGGLIANNVVTDCELGLQAGYDFDGVATLTVEANRFVYGLTGDRPVSAVYMVAPLSRVNFRNNYIEGGDFTSYALRFAGSSTYRFGHVLVEADTVTSAAGSALVVDYADTVAATGNVLTGLSRGVSTGRKAAVWLSNISDSTRVTRNTITGNALSGMLLSGSVANILVDTNLVADNADSGLVFWQSNVAGDTVRGRFNTIRRNGVGVMTYVADLYLDSNNIEGNVVGVYNDDADTVFVANNWWGDVLGPRCSLLDATGQSLCDPGAVGDSLTGWTGATYVVSPVAVDTIAPAPLGAPPAMAPASAATTGAVTSGISPDALVPMRPEPPQLPTTRPSESQGQGAGSALRRSQGSGR